MKRKPHSEETKRKISEAKKGHVPWNKGMRGLKIGFAVIPQPKKHWAKGLKKTDHPSIMSWSKHHENEGNPFWRGGISQGYLYKKALEYGLLKRKRCMWCKKREIRRKGGLVVHHKDRDRTNNSRENLVLICSTCHQREHNPRYGTGKKKN